MIGIGEFSHSTGLSIKTLRYYHDIGLLPAAHVDEYNGYRSYRAEQLQQAALLRVLRATGMGIAQMKQALTHPHELDDMLQERRKELDAQRALEDWALKQAPRWRDPIAMDAVRTRECEALRWVGVEARVDLKELGDDPEDSEVEEHFMALQEGVEQLLVHLGERGVDVAPDSFWMSFTSDPRQPSVLRASYCVQTSSESPVDLRIDGVDVVSGELPRRTEAFVTTAIPSDGEPTADDLMAARLPGGMLPHPTGLALSLAAELAGVDSPPVRQRTVDTPDGQVVEHSLTLTVH